MNQPTGKEIFVPETPQILEPKHLEMADDVRSNVKEQVDKEWAIMLAALPPPANKDLRWIPHVHCKKLEGGINVTITPKLKLKPEKERVG